METFKIDETQNSALLTWRNVSVYVLDLRRKVCKQVVTNVRGAVQPGELTGILGGSGSGKSSLMTALAFRNPTSLTVQGDIRVNGCPVDPQYMRQNSGYMHQDDIFIDTMTVIEHLWFMARMKLDRDIAKFEIESRIKTLLSSVGLSARRNVTIGNTESNKVLSGGEKKRLAFATELLSDPPILFLDEPTTGQDAHTASILVDQLQSFASRGHTVLCTIHQPSSAVFRSFQKIILVAEGRIAFAGTNEEAIKFFSSLGYVCPHTYNPADFLIGTIVATSNNKRGEVMSIQRICDAFLSSDACKEIDLIIQLQLHIAEFKEHWQSIKAKARKSPKFYTKLRWLIHRGALQVVRDPTLQILRILQKLAIAIVAGLCFFGAIKLDQLGVQAVQGVIFIMVSENTFFPMYSTLSLIPQEFPLFFREYKAGMYPVHLYYIARIASLIPGLILEPILFTSIVYWLAGLANTISAFFTTLGIVLLTMNVSTACGCFFSAAFDNVPQAMAYLVPFDYLLMITMGSFIRLSSLPIYIQWVKYISWLLHSTEALSIVQWQDIKNISCPIGTAEGLPCIREGIQVLQQYDFEIENFSLDIFSMIAIYFAFHLLGYIFLLKRCKQIKFL